MLKILLTGGAGFIGSFVTDELLRAGHRVTVVDNLGTGSRHNLPRDVDLIIADIRDETIDGVFASVKPDVVVHLAAQTSVNKSFVDPINDVETNVTGTLRILDNCVKHGVEKVIYASTAAAYGNPVYLPINEQHPLQPLSFYGLSKLTPEKYIKRYHSLFGLRYTILRLANVYGPRQDVAGEGGVISIILSRLMSRQKAVIFGDGHQTRDFIYVKDVAKAFLAALTDGDGGTYNVSTGVSTSVNQVTELACSLVGQPFCPEYRPALPGDIIHSILDNSSAVEHLNWQPSYAFEDGLKETFEGVRIPMIIAGGAE